MTTTRNDSGMWILCDTLFTPFQLRRDWLLQIADGKIHRMLPEGIEDIPEERRFHLPDAMVAPGFLDLHVHGASGKDLMEGTSEALQTVSSSTTRSV